MGKVKKDNYGGIIRLEFDPNSERDKKAIDNLNDRDKQFQEKLNITLTKNQLMRSAFKQSQSKGGKNV